MSSTPARARRRALLPPLLALLVVLSAGCASWRVQQGTAQEVIVTRQPNRVRVTTREGERTVLQQPRAIQGILRGYDEACWDRLGPRSDGCPEVGYLLSDVQVVEVREHDRRGLVLGAVGLMAVFIYMVKGI